MSNGPIEKFNKGFEYKSTMGVQTFKFPLKSLSSILLMTMICLCLVGCSAPAVFIANKFFTSNNEAKEDFITFCETLTDDHQLAQELISKDAVTLNPEVLEILAKEIGSCDSVTTSSTSYNYDSNKLPKEAFNLEGEINNIRDKISIEFKVIMSKENGEWKPYEITLY